MKKEDIDKKQSEITKKIVNAKKKVAEKPKQPESTWLEQYISNPQGSGAKLVTSLIARPDGATIEECIKMASEFGAKKSPPSKFGSTRSSVKSHIKYLASKGCEIIELGEDRYKVTQK